MVSEPQFRDYKEALGKLHGTSLGVYGVGKSVIEMADGGMASRRIGELVLLVISAPVSSLTPASACR